MKKQMKQSIKAIMRTFSAAFIMAIVLMIGITAYAAEGTVKSSDVNVRSDASTTSTAVGTVTTNDKVTILEEKTGDDGKVWYKISTSTGITGYVRSDFITKSSNESNNNNSSSETTTNVTTTDAKTAYIAGNGSVNIRKEASTKSTLVASAKGQSEVTITGEAKAADGYKWYQIKFKADGKDMTGFIRSDLVTFTAPIDNSAPAETTIEGNMGEEPETPVEEVPEEPVVPEEPETQEDTNSSMGKNIVYLNPDGEPSYIPDGFSKVNITIGGEQITGWGKGDFYILYAMKGESDPAWFLCDYKNGGFVAYDGLFDGATAKKASVFDGRIIIVVMAGLLVIAIVVIALLAVKLSRKNDSYDEYDYDNDSDDDIYNDSDDEYSAFSESEDDVDTEYEEEEDYDEKPVKKAAKKDKKAKKQKGNALKNFFTKEVDDEDEFEDYDEDDDDSYVSASESNADDDDDDDEDFDFIDL